MTSTAVKPTINSRLLEALQSEDEVGVVVRAHIHLELQLTELLKALLPDPSALEDIQLRYAQRVHLAVALGLKAQFRGGLLAIGNLRNEFAHKPGMTLSKATVNKLHSALSEDERKLVKATYDRVNGRQATKLASFEKLAPKDKFSLLVVALEAMFVVALKEARRL